MTIDNEEQYRAPDEWETAVLNRLLSHDFPERTAVIRQLEGSKVRTVDLEGSIEFLIGPQDAIDPGALGVVVEGEAEDSDGVTLHFMLHVARGMVKELEIYREDGGQILGRVNPSSIRIYT
jgi:hypothetical protein